MLRKYCIEVCTNFKKLLFIFAIKLKFVILCVCCFEKCDFGDVKILLLNYVMVICFKKGIIIVIILCGDLNGC